MLVGDGEVGPRVAEGGALQPFDEPGVARTDREGEAQADGVPVAEAAGHLVAIGEQVEAAFASVDRRSVERYRQLVGSARP